MRRNIDKTRRAVEAADNVSTVSIEQTSKHNDVDLGLSVLVEDLDTEFQELIADLGLKITKPKFLGSFGVEVLLTEDEDR